MRGLYLALVAAAALTGCNVAAPNKDAAQTYSAPNEPIVVKVSFSDAAQAKLKESGERVTINAMYYAEPKPSIADRLEPGDPGVALGEDLVEIDGVTQEATVPGAFDTAKANAEAQGDVRVLLNVYTARKVFEDNLLSCGIYDDTVEKAGREGMAIECALIEEPAQTMR
jgi:hypothetical protein